MSLSSPLYILGGRSLVGPYLMQQLTYQGRGAKSGVTAFSRRPACRFRSFGT